MKHQLKKNTAAEQTYVRKLERRGPLENIERGEAQIVRSQDYPEPLKRFLARERSMLHLQLSSPVKRKLEQISRATGVSIDELARRWVKQGIAREAS